MRGLIKFHPRLSISLLFGTALFFCLPSAWGQIDRILVAWDAGVSLFLALVLVWMNRLSAADICLRYAEEDESGPIILVAVTVSALLSLVAIVEPLATLRHVQGAERAWHFALAAATLIDSWVLVATMFTTHYADMYYSAAEADRPLNFPDTDKPVFWDFAYFSFTVAAACQTADVSTRHTDIRKVLIAQQLISFLFNASILGFAINVTAGLIGS